MKFPRPYKNVGKCIAIVQTNYQPLPMDKYPRIYFNGKNWQAHRLSFNLNCKHIVRNPAPKRNWGNNKMVLHTCNHKWCINPKHLYLGGHKENGYDRWNIASKQERKKFSQTMKLTCNNPIYIKNMIAATTGISKSKEWKRKARLAWKKRRLKFASARATVSKPPRAT